MLPVDGSPLQRKRSNRNLGKLGGYFFLLVSILASQRDNCNDNHAKSKKAFPCNHEQHPLSISIGGKRSVTPEKKAPGEPPTVFTGSTTHNVAQNLTNCKKNMLHYTLSISLSAIKSLTVWRAVSSPGGSGHQRIDIGFVRHYLAALPPRAG